MWNGTVGCLMKRFSTHTNAAIPNRPKIRGTSTSAEAHGESTPPLLRPATAAVVDTTKSYETARVVSPYVRTPVVLCQVLAMFA